MPKINSANNSTEVINLNIFARIDPRKTKHGKFNRSANSIYRSKKRTRSDLLTFYQTRT